MQSNKTICINKKNTYSISVLTKQPCMTTEQASATEELNF